jgi:hypothetical protein
MWSNSKELLLESIDPSSIYILCIFFDFYEAHTRTQDTAMIGQQFCLFL